MLTTKHIFKIVDMCKNTYVMIDVSSCRETTITRIHNTLLGFTQMDASTIEKMTHGKNVF